MNHNLNQLRQNYCRPTTVSGKTIPHLFPLEKECAQGKALVAKAPKALFHFREFDPSGLEQTYRDDATGAELPVFAVFNLEGNHRFTSEITVESISTNADSISLSAHIPFRKTQASVKKINERRIKAEGVFTPVSFMLGIVLGAIPAAVYMFSHTIGMTRGVASLILIGSAFGTFLTYLLSERLLDWRCPW